MRRLYDKTNSRVTTAKTARCLALAGTILVLNGCNGSPAPLGTTTPPPTPTLQQRIDATTNTVANNTACTSITPFYWEIGDASSFLASGAGGNNSAPTPASFTLMPIASASKWIFSTYVAEKQIGVLTTTDIKYLNFKSGYSNLSNCSTATVDSCLSEPGLTGGTNGDYVIATDDQFFYNGGHMQKLASSMGLGSYNNTALTIEIGNIGVGVNIVYVQPQLAGGIIATPGQYALFLRNMLSGTYSYMLNLLGSNPVCTHTNSIDCPTAMFNPINQSAPGMLTNDVSNEAWHYSLGHWVEDDPTVGDGAFSSPGLFGFYPWINQSKTYYGILARYDTVNVTNPDPQKAPYITSVSCGRLIRKAWELGQPQ